MEKLDRPALKRWATFVCPCGTVPRNRLKEL